MWPEFVAWPTLATLDLPLFATYIYCFQLIFNLVNMMRYVVEVQPAVLVIMCSTINVKRYLAEIQRAVLITTQCS